MYVKIIYIIIGIILFSFLLDYKFTLEANSWLKDTKYELIKENSKLNDILKKEDKFIYWHNKSAYKFERCGLTKIHSLEDLSVLISQRYINKDGE